MFYHADCAFFGLATARSAPELGTIFANRKNCIQIKIDFSFCFALCKWIWFCRSMTFYLCAPEIIYLRFSFEIWSNLDKCTKFSVGKSIVYFQHCCPFFEFWHRVHCLSVYIHIHCYTSLSIIRRTWWECLVPFTIQSSIELFSYTWYCYTR